jgi:hypothetical protein
MDLYKSNEKGENPMTSMLRADLEFYHRQESQYWEPLPEIACDDSMEESVWEMTVDETVKVEEEMMVAFGEEENTKVEEETMVAFGEDTKVEEEMMVAFSEEENTKVEEEEYEMVELADKLLEEEEVKLGAWADKLLEEEVQLGAWPDKLLEEVQLGAWVTLNKQRFWMVDAAIGNYRVPPMGDPYTSVSSSSSDDV